jgi:hypothetical protein
MVAQYQAPGESGCVREVKVIVHYPAHTPRVAPRGSTRAAELGHEKVEVGDQQAAPQSPGRQAPSTGEGCGTGPHAKQQQARLEGHEMCQPRQSRRSHGQEHEHGRARRYVWTQPARKRQPPEATEQAGKKDLRRAPQCARPAAPARPAGRKLPLPQG